MTTLSMLQASVQGTLQDAAYTPTILANHINSGLRRCAYLVLLPDLETTGIVITNPSSSSVEIPGDWNFCRNLYAAHIADNPEIQVLSSMGLLRMQVPDIDNTVHEGDVNFITTRKTNIIYANSPAEPKTLVCKFYENPTLLVNPTHVPSELPESLQEPLLVNYALWKCFESIEDGIEGAKVNTAYYKNEFSEAINELLEIFTAGQSTPTPNRDSAWV